MPAFLRVLTRIADFDVICVVTGYHMHGHLQTEMLAIASDANPGLGVWIFGTEPLVIFDATVKKRM
jgi:hypothetical protein